MRAGPPRPSTRLAGTRPRAGRHPSRHFPRNVSQETEEDLQRFIEVVSRGITVRRLDLASFGHDQHRAVGNRGTTAPRILLVIGDTIIETPNVIRGRSLETGSYRQLLWNTEARTGSAADRRQTLRI